MDRQIAWVKLAKYVEMTGDSADAVRGRRKLGKWLDGNECKIVDGNLWINLHAVEQWIENWGRRSPRAAEKKPND
jgi:hypothetical protein